MSKEKREDVARRVAKIHGHLHGIMEMVNDGRSYSEIVQQISAVKSALDSTVQLIVDDLVEEYVKQARKGKNQAAEELKQVVHIMN